MRKRTMWLAAIFLLAGVFPVQAEGSQPSLPEVPVKGMVTMLDLGAKKCIPCKMMAPILVKMEKTYKGKAAIVFIDVSQHRDQGKRFGIWSIPTQIFFDKNGKEVYRHAGFMSEKDIVGQFRKMGVAQDKSDAPKETNAHRGSN
jgi:thioredoxin 1